MGGLALGRLMPIDLPGTGFREPEEFTDLETVEVIIDRVGITPPPGTTGTGLKS
jgi:hypothetical protein